MNMLYRTFFNAVKWNTLGITYYQGVFIVHQILLFRTIAPTEYGTIGIIFSLLYASVSFIELGLTAHLASFFKQYATSKQSFSHYFAGQIAIHAIALFLFITSVAALKSHIIKYLFPASLSSSLYWWCIAIVVGEALKRPLKSFLQVAFLSKKIACLESAALTMYVAIVWSRIVIGRFSFGLIFQTWSVILLSESLLILFFTHQWYQSLPQQSTADTTIKKRTIVKNRALCALYEMSSLALTSNILVPIIGLCGSTHNAGILKLISYLMQSLNGILQKIFGISSITLFVHTKQDEHREKTFAFNLLSRWLYTIGYTLFFLLCINSTLFVTENTMLPWYLLCSFIALGIFENFFIVHQKWCIIHETFTPLFITSLLYWIAISRIVNLSLQPIITAIVIFGLRILGFLVLSTYTNKKWELPLLPRPYPRALVLLCVIGLTITVVIQKAFL